MSAAKEPRRYIVPVVHHCTFGCEVIVEATSAKEAERLATSDLSAEVASDGYNWNRFRLERATLGTWQKTKKES